MATGPPAEGSHVRQREAVRVDTLGAGCPNHTDLRWAVRLREGQPVTFLAYFLPGRGRCPVCLNDENGELPAEGAGRAPELGVR